MKKLPQDNKYSMLCLNYLFVSVLALAAALEVISREDPSVRVEYLDNGTIVLSGMGELHMDIVVERIKKDFKVDAYIGPLQVAYREIPTEAAKYEGIENCICSIYYAVDVIN